MNKIEFILPMPCKPKDEDFAIKGQNPIAIYPYNNELGKVNFFVARYENFGQKYFQPLSYADNGHGIQKFVRKLPPVPRSLFNLDKISLRPDARVLVVEGEKAAVAAAKLFGNDFVVVTSCSGSHSYKMSDWSPLRGKEVVVWPDNDDSGVKYATGVAELLSELGAMSVHIVGIPSSFPLGWDLADPLPQNIEQAALASLIQSASLFETPLKKLRSDSFVAEAESSAEKVRRFILCLFEDPRFAFFHDQHEQAQVFVKSPDLQRVFGVRSEKFKKLVNKEFFRITETQLSREQLESVISAVEGKSLFESDTKELNVRLCSQTGSIYYDLGDGMVKIDESGWSVVPQEQPLFRWFEIMRKQVKPVNGDVRELLKFINIKNEQQKLLLLVFLVSCFVPDIPHPVLAVYGDKGSAKSSLLRLLTSIVDPSNAPETMISKLSDLIQRASHGLVLFLDNLSFISEEISDWLCVIVTGASYSRRRLYTDDEDVFGSMRRIVLLNGINLPVTKSDLLDRCLLLELERIPDAMRRDETTLKKEIEIALPRILGGCFSILSKAMSLVKNVQLAEKPRMADFAIYGEAISLAMGYSEGKFVEAYRNNIKMQHLEAVEASALGAVILFAVEREVEITGTPRQVLNILKRYASEANIDGKELPLTDRSFGHQLRHIKSNLEEVGLVVSITRGRVRNVAIHRRNRNDTNVAMTNFQGTIENKSDDVEKQQ